MLNAAGKRVRRNRFLSISNGKNEKVELSMSDGPNTILFKDEIYFIEKDSEGKLFLDLLVDESPLWKGENTDILNEGDNEDGWWW